MVRNNPWPSFAPPFAPAAHRIGVHPDRARRRNRPRLLRQCGRGAFTETQRRTRTATASTRPAHDWGPVSELAVETGAPRSGDTPVQANAGPYDPWHPGVVRISGAIAHPTPLVQSAAMRAETRESDDTTRH